jgi:hypothetical protein
LLLPFLSDLRGRSLRTLRSKAFAFALAVAFS